MEGHTVISILPGLTSGALLVSSIYCIVLFISGTRVKITPYFSVIDLILLSTVLFLWYRGGSYFIGFKLVFLCSVFLFAMVQPLIFARIYIQEKKSGEDQRNKLADVYGNIDKIISERTKQLEENRDSVAAYAVQEFERAQEMERQNDEIREQKDIILKQAEGLRLAYEEKKRLDGFKKQMTRMLIHDLKNPLNVLLNIVEKNDLQPRSSGTVRQISQEMLDLVMNILDVSKFEDSRMKIDYVNFALAPLIEKVFRKYSFLKGTGTINIISNVSPDYVLSGDEFLTGRILDNLLSNAIKFSHQGANIRLMAEESGEFIRIDVKNNGEPIPENMINDVFDEYFHFQGKKDHFSNSTGIGLTFCKLAIEAQGGDIGIISQPDGETIVWFTTPKGLTGTSVPSGPGGEEFNFHIGNKHILSDEDKSVISNLINDLKATDIYNYTTILKILSAEVCNSNERIIKWRNTVEEAVFKSNEKRFRELLEI